LKRIEDYLCQIKPVQKSVADRVQKRLDSQTKPQGSLGRLEIFCIQLAQVQGTDSPSYGKKIIFTLAADHGVVEEGVSAYPQSVTAQMVANFLRGGAGVSVLAKHAGCDVVVVDIGVARSIDAKGYIDRKIDLGTKNFTQGPAMTREQAEISIVTGIELAVNYDFDIIGTGDMGIGNTTPSSAVAGVLTGIDPERITGRGTGIDDVTLRKKIDTIRRGIEINNPDPADPIDVLAKVGGFEIGGIAGLIIGAAVKRKLAVVDGFISTAGAMIASSLNKDIADYFLLSHLSAEKGHDLFAEYLGKKPVLDLGMRLGEGTGAALAIELIDAAMCLYYGMATFEQAGVDKKK
jgi:nicotinate-nucleotide--dimethylbenzimidazole phosphoribosyltransferase